MTFTELFEFAIGDHEFSDVPQGLLRVILAHDHEHLEAFPAKWLQSRDMGVHVFSEIQAADHCVYLKHDAEFAAPSSDFVKLSHLISRTSSDLNISFFVKGIA